MHEMFLLNFFAHSLWTTTLFSSGCAGAPPHASVQSDLTKNLFVIIHRDIKLWGKISNDLEKLFFATETVFGTVVVEIHPAMSRHIEPHSMGEMRSEMSSSFSTPIEEHSVLLLFIMQKPLAFLCELNYVGKVIWYSPSLFSPPSLSLSVVRIVNELCLSSLLSFANWLEVSSGSSGFGCVVCHLTREIGQGIHSEVKHCGKQGMFDGNNSIVWKTDDWSRSWTHLWSFWSEITMILISYDSNAQRLISTGKFSHFLVISLSFWTSSLMKKIIKTEKCHEKSIEAFNRCPRFIVGLDFFFSQMTCYDEERKKWKRKKG